MGEYFFTDLEGNEAKVEYTFGYKLIDGALKIDLHHSCFHILANFCFIKFNRKAFNNI